jgi:hypothetical protein
MTPSTDAEVSALWSAVFGGPPAITASASMMLAILIDQLQTCPPYTPFDGPLDLGAPIGEP